MLGYNIYKIYMKQIFKPFFMRYGRKAEGEGGLAGLSSCAEGEGKGLSSCAEEEGGGKGGSMGLALS